MEGTQA
jgi:ornithine decarboxylase